MLCGGRGSPALQTGAGARAAAAAASRCDLIWLASFQCYHFKLRFRDRTYYEYDVFTTTNLLLWEVYRDNTSREPPGLQRGASEVVEEPRASRKVSSLVVFFISLIVIALSHFLILLTIRSFECIVTRTFIELYGLAVSHVVKCRDVTIFNFIT